MQEGCQAIAHAVMEKNTKARGPGYPQGMMNGSWAPTAAYNIEEWMQGLEEEASNGEVRNGDAGDLGLGNEAPVPSMLVKVVDDIDSKKNHNFLETPQVAHPLLGMVVLIGQVIKVPSSWPWLECPEKVTDQCGQEEVLGWR